VRTIVRAVGTRDHRGARSTPRPDSVFGEFDLVTTMGEYLRREQPTLLLSLPTTVEAVEEAAMSRYCAILASDEADRV
jgi:hypothetical protein